MSARSGSTFSFGWLVLLTCLLGVLPTLGFASPPDPTWIGGIYDDADYDDVVVLVTSASADVSPPVPDLLSMLRELGGIPPCPDGFVPRSSLSLVLPRGPPTS
jgi:hypothetical protein